MSRLCLILLVLYHYIDMNMGNTETSQGPTDFPLKFEEKELRERLSPQQYDVTQKQGTERAFTGVYWDSKKTGVYRCVVCDEELFSSSTKFDSGTGWPSFYDLIRQGSVKELVDTSLGIKRTEIVCSKCGAHLGHLFNDGPQPTGKRYCMNSASLRFKNTEENTKQDL